MRFFSKCGRYGIKALVWCVVWSMLMICLPAKADIYVYRDKQGILHFSNAPASSKYQLYFKKHQRFTVHHTVRRSFQHVITEAAKKHGVSEALLKAVIKVESDYDPQAVSCKGAKGLMQIMPQNFARCNIHDPFDPQQNIMGGTRYLKSLIEHFDGDLGKALAAYNAGIGAVERSRGIPPIPETRNYVSKVLKLYRYYRR